MSDQERLANYCQRAKAAIGVPGNWLSADGAAAYQLQAAILLALADLIDKREQPTHLSAGGPSGPPEGVRTEPSTPRSGDLPTDAGAGPQPVAWGRNDWTSNIVWGAQRPQGDGWLPLYARPFK